MLSDPVALDDRRTWPPPLAALLGENLSILRQHAEFDEDRYDGLRDGLSQAELQRMRNPFLEERAVLHRDATCILAGHSVVAWHCTRFTDDEIEAVQREGLRCLDRTAMRHRIEGRVRAGDLSGGEAATLVQRLEARGADELRRGKLWAVLSELALTDEHGLSQPLKYWGGEVVLCYENGGAEVLRKLGTGCLVEFSAPISSAVVIDVVEPFLQRFLYIERGLGDDGAADACFDDAIPAHNIRRIIRRRDSDFDRLTCCSEWNTAIT